MRLDGIEKQFQFTRKKYVCSMKMQCEKYLNNILVISKSFHRRRCTGSNCAKRTKMIMNIRALVNRKKSLLKRSTRYYILEKSLKYIE